jgi:phenylalanyl-tRNA synthetase alpha chain
VSISIQNILQELQASEISAIADLDSLNDIGGLQQFRGKFLGKSSFLKTALSFLPNLPEEDRKTVGQEVNRIRTRLEEQFQLQQEKVTVKKQNSSSFDPTLPGKLYWSGHLHVLTQVLDEIKSIFKNIGFVPAYGPEVEDDWHNFEALNHPAHHPARDMQDTFYISEKLLLRTHTSPVQIRVMEKQKPPIRIIAPGRVYRNEEISARSYCLFHQVEGLFVDEYVSFADLKGTINFFLEKFFGAGTPSRFRPSFFPFTEPSAEVDIRCFLCKGKGCPICKKSGWLEILGCGMVNPNVFAAVNVDSEKYSGFAFGMGVERPAILKYAVGDIRLFYENDKRFLEMF